MITLKEHLPETKSHLVPLTRRSLAQDALARIRHAIVAAELAEGSPLPEDQLAAQLGVSRVPIREALTQLELEGLVEVDTRGRSRVRNFSKEGFEDVYSMRSALEMMSARLAVQRMTAADSADLEAMIDKQATAVDLTDLSVQDVDLHERIIQITRHRQLLVCWKTIRSQIEVWLARAHRAQSALHLSSVEITVPGHRRLLAALRSGDVKQAEYEMNMEMITFRDWILAGAAKQPPKRPE
ncbi:MAG TPA: GntR family transcriptional regulator [Planctomycetota bacterium]|nr:GntR family transcriptional regulator [Planctomycetota bacterium]